MKQYPSHKPSGVEWIGEMPKHWKVKRLKYVATSNPSNVDKKSVEGEQEVRLCNYTDVYKNEFITNDLPLMSATATEEQINKFNLEEGDVLATKDSEDPKDIAIPAVVKNTLPGVVCGYHLTHIKPDKTQVNGFYLFRLFQSYTFNQQFTVQANGITRYGLPTAAFSNAFICLPPLAEQQVIANYLNQKTALIDETILKKQRLIELLQEERAALINQAVTRGLNPDVKLKPSGVEWLGDVPEHWNIRPLKYVGVCQNGVSANAEYFGSGYPFVSYGDVYKNITLPEKVTGLAMSTEVERDRFSVLEGDVFFTRTSETIEEIGLTSTCMKTIEKAVFAGFLIRFRPFEGLLFKEFSKYFFRSELHRRFFVKEMNLVTRASLSQELLKRLPILLPPIDEQVMIAKALDQKISDIIKIIIKAQQEILLLQEYRTALINEVVTGKRCVVPIPEEVFA